MAVYVDDMYQYELGKYGRMKMSHMIADTDEELHEMAQKIGVAKNGGRIRRLAATTISQCPKEKKRLSLALLQ